MVMPRSRSSSMLSSTWLVISRSLSAPVAWISRSARVDFPWSIWAMIAKFRMWSIEGMAAVRGQGLVLGLVPRIRGQIEGQGGDVILAFRLDLVLAGVSKRARGLAMHRLIDDRRTEIAILCRRYGVRRLEVFGSAARGADFHPDSSDADFLVSFEPKSSLSALEQFFGFSREM